MTTTTMTTRSALAANLRRLRTDRELSVPSLASAASLSIDYVWRIERGERWPSAETLDSLAAALGTDAGTLISPAKTKAKKLSGKSPKSRLSD